MFESHHLENGISKSNLSQIDTPNFDELLSLATHNPLEFERLRTELCQKVIALAPDNIRPRLEGLQFTVDMERKRSGSSTSACMKLSSMMSESLLELQEALSNPEEYLRYHQSPKQSAEIIPLFPNK